MTNIEMLSKAFLKVRGNNEYAHLQDVREEYIRLLKPWIHSPYREKYLNKLSQDLKGT